jgi:hypothetical protein
MENKKSFILYADLLHTVQQLPNETAGELFKHILLYVNDKDPKTENLLVNVVFEPVKQSLKRDLEKWAGIREKRSAAGSKGGRPKKEIQIEEPKKANVFLEKQLKAKKAVNVNVNVNGSVNEISFKKETKFIFTEELYKIGFEKELINDWLQVRKNKKAANTETALKAFVKEVEKTGQDKNEILKICIINSWAGFKNDWLNNNNSKTLQNGSKKPTRESVKHEYLQNVLSRNNGPADS